MVADTYPSGNSGGAGGGDGGIVHYPRRRYQG